MTVTKLLSSKAASAFALLLLLAGCGPADHRPTADELRHAVAGSDLWIVLVDAGAASHFSFYGYDRPTTPRLAELATTSIVFDNAYAQASATPLSCYSWMTSRYPHMQSPTPDQPELAAVITPEMPTLASRFAPVFAQRGAIVGNQWIARRLGFDHGFTHFDEAFAHTVNQAPAHADLIAAGTTDWWHQADQPRLTYTHFLEPHEPYTPPQPYRSLFDPEIRGLVDGTRASLDPIKHRSPDPRTRRNVVALYDGNLAYVDARIGALIDQLVDSGRWDDTTFVLLSDHGEAFWQHGSRGHGDHIYEEYIRVPLLLHLPASVQVAPQRVSHVVELVDLLPTLLDLYSVPAEPTSMAGRSLLPLLSRDLPDTLGRPVERAFFRNHDGAHVELGVRRESLKYQHFYGRKLDELYDLQSDPHETSNLLKQSTPPPSRIAPVDEAKKLFAMIQQWVRRGAGVADGLGASAADLDSLSDDERARLKALGYFE